MSRRSSPAPVWRRVLFLGAVVFVATVGFAVYALKVTQIRVVGTRTISPNVVIAASGLHGGERILWTQMSAVERRIERVPGVAAVRVDRSLPGTVIIRVRERTPLVGLDTRPGLAADAFGVVFGFDGAATLPVLSAWRGTARPGSALDPASRAILDAFATFPSDLKRRTRRVAAGNAVVLTLDDGTEIRFGVPIDLDAKARAAEAVLQVTAERGEVLEYIDVRAPSAPASRRRGAGPASPGPRGAGDQTSSGAPQTPAPTPPAPAGPTRSPGA